MCPIHNAVDTFTVSSSFGFVSHFNYALLFPEVLLNKVRLVVALH